MKTEQCSIDGCNGYIQYQHLGLCKNCYNKLNIDLGWDHPSMYLQPDTAKQLIEDKIKYKEAINE